MSGTGRARCARKRLSRILKFSTVAGVLIAASGAAAEVPGDLPKVPPELEPVRETLAKYQNPVVAVREGYFSTLGCVQYPGGGMGVHFLNPQLFGPVPDPMAPQILVYEPDAEGQLHLVAAEWFIPLATGVDGRPEIFGQPFNGPMEGHEPLIPKEVHHYDLHVWLFKENPAGLFNATNPDVNCVGAYVIHEEPPPEVPHH
jgi:hypothetical protein